MPRTLVISPTVTHPQDAGNRARIHRFVRELTARGHEVTFVFVGFEEGDRRAMERAWGRYHEVPAPLKLERLGMEIMNGVLSLLPGRPAVPYRLDSWYPAALDRWLEAHLRDYTYDVVVVNYVYLSRALNKFPERTLKLIDTHDVYGDRHQLFREQGVKAGWYFIRSDAEAKGIARADAVLAIQDAEAEHFRELVPGLPVLTVGHAVDLPSGIGGGETNDPTLLFVGSPNRANYTGLMKFIHEALPRLREEYPMLRLAVVGGVAERFGSAPPGCDLVGRVPDLAEMYRSAWVVLNLMTFGTGLKIKTVEALAHGKPLVTTPVGAAGLEAGAGTAFIIAENSENLVSAVGRLVADPGARRDMGQEAVDFVREYNRGVYVPLHDFIEANAR